MSDGTTPHTAAIRLPVWRTTREAYRMVFRHLRPSLNAAVVPAIILSGLMMAFPRVFPFAVAQGQWVSSPVYFAYAITLLVPFAMFAVAWHRFILLGPDAGSTRWLPAWKTRHWRFLAFLVILETILLGQGVLDFNPSLLVLKYMPPDSVILTIAGLWLIYLVAFYLSMRFSFVFPAMALDQSYGLRRAWRDTRGQGLRLMAVQILVMIPLFLPFFGIELADLWFSSELPNGCELTNIEPPSDSSITDPAYRLNCPEEGFSYFTILLPVVYFLTTALLVSTVSIAFRTCTGWMPAVSSPPNPSGVSG